MEKDFDDLKKKHSEIDDVRQDMNEHIQKLEHENEKLHDKLLDMQ